jgi:hypothetical protein
VRERDAIESIRSLADQRSDVGGQKSQFRGSPQITSTFNVVTGQRFSLRVVRHPEGTRLSRRGDCGRFSACHSVAKATR